MTDAMTTEAQLEALGIPEAEACMLAGALRMMALVDPKSIGTALSAIDHAQTMAPFLDPTGLVTGRLRFGRGDRNADLLRAARKLAEVLRAPEGYCQEDGGRGDGTVCACYPYPEDLNVSEIQQRHEAVGDAIDEVSKQLAQVVAKHRPLASAHEAYGVIAEEHAELLDEVRKREDDPTRIAGLRKEAKDIAVACIRLMAEIGEEPTP